MSKDGRLKCRWWWLMAGLKLSLCSSWSPMVELEVDGEEEGRTLEILAHSWKKVWNPPKSLYKPLLYSSKGVPMCYAPIWKKNGSLRLENQSWFHFTMIDHGHGTLKRDSHDRLWFHHDRSCSVSWQFLPIFGHRGVIIRSRPRYKSCR